MDLVREKKKERGKLTNTHVSVNVGSPCRAYSYVLSPTP